MNDNFWKNKSVVVTGGHGFLGKHLVKMLTMAGCKLFVPTKKRYDLRNPSKMKAMVNSAINGKIDVLFHLAANVGGIGYNQKNPYHLFYENAIMGIDLIHLSLMSGVRKFVQIGTACSYPRDCRIPFNEDDLWDGYPEETNAPYGMAKKMLLTQLQAARTQYGFNGIYLIPTNLYGPGDNFDLETSHVIPALIRKFTEAKGKNEVCVTFWGTGGVSRDFLYVEDAAKGIMLAAEKYNEPEPLNLGSGGAITITSLAASIRDLINYHGDIKWDDSKPNGQPRRLLNSKRALDALGWKAETNLQVGLHNTIEWYKENKCQKLAS